MTTGEERRLYDQRGDYMIREETEIGNAKKR